MQKKSRKYRFRKKHTNNRISGRGSRKLMKTRTNRLRVITPFRIAERMSVQSNVAFSLKKPSIFGGLNEKMYKTRQIGGIGACSPGDEFNKPECSTLIIETMQNQVNNNSINSLLDSFATDYGKGNVVNALAELYKSNEQNIPDLCDFLKLRFLLKENNNSEDIKIKHELINELNVIKTTAVKKLNKNAKNTGLAGESVQGLSVEQLLTKYIDELQQKTNTQNQSKLKNPIKPNQSFKNGGSEFTPKEIALATNLQSCYDALKKNKKYYDTLLASSPDSKTLFNAFKKKEKEIISNYNFRVNEINQQHTPDKISDKISDKMSDFKSCLICGAAGIVFGVVPKFGGILLSITLRALLG